MNALLRRNAPYFDIVGFPCNQFGLQEPGKNSEILNGIRYVRPGSGFVPQFDLATKLNVNGLQEHPIYTFLKGACRQPSNMIGDPRYLFWNPVKVSDITWNFEKFLIDSKGKPRYRFQPNTKIAELLPHVDQLLKADKMDSTPRPVGSPSWKSYKNV